MARVKNGVNGNPSGTVGSVVFCKWKDITYVRSLPKVNKRRKITSKESKNRNKFGFTQNLLSPYTSIIRLGFHHYRESMTAFNAAMSYHLSHAILLDEDGIRINYEKFSISRGLEEAVTATSFEVDGTQLLIKWQLKNRDEFIHHKWDHFRTLILLIPEDANNLPNGTLLGNHIDDLNDSLQLPIVNKDSVYHLYLGFAATDGSNQSMNSVYVGQVNLRK